MAKRLDKAERARRERAIAARSATVGKPRPKTARPKPTSAKPQPAKPKGRFGATYRGVGSELAERAAWSMLAALTALAGAGLALAIGSAVTPALCPDDDGSCGLGWMVLIGMVGYLLALLPASAIGRLGIWFWVAYVAGCSPMLMLAAVGDWWWWTALVLLPMAASVASAPLGHDRLPTQQRFGLLGLAAIGVAFVTWWYVLAPN
ncbi:MAG: hypothetical protein QM619_16755 [Micropruina sp.]|uniref:hypothetical protein n=1 Tax=Micropruina sp. TaxID=2737536 RepID=UPI0039E6C899